MILGFSIHVHYWHLILFVLSIKSSFFSFRSVYLNIILVSGLSYYHFLYQSTEPTSRIKKRKKKEKKEKREKEKKWKREKEKKEEKKEEKKDKRRKSEKGLTPTFLCTQASNPYLVIFGVRRENFLMGLKMDFKFEILGILVQNPNL